MHDERPARGLPQARSACHVVSAIKEKRARDSGQIELPKGQRRKRASRKMRSRGFASKDRSIDSELAPHVFQCPHRRRKRVFYGWKDPVIARQTVFNAGDDHLAFPGDRTVYPIVEAGIAHHPCTTVEIEVNAVAWTGGL